MSVPKFIANRAPRSPDAGAPAGPNATRPLIGTLLVEQDVLSEHDLARALDMQQHENVSLGEILIAQGLIEPEHLTAALARQYRSDMVDLTREPPDPALANLFDPSDCIRLGFLPWQRQNRRLLIAVARPDVIDMIRRRLPPEFEQVEFVLCDTQSLHDAITETIGHRLVDLAERRTPEQFSCRNWSTNRSRVYASVGAAVCVAAMLWSASLTIGVFLATATFILILNTVLKATCGAMALWRSRFYPDPPRVPVNDTKLPRISMLVPLFKEDNIAKALIARLSRIDYPPELLEICLVIEQDDLITRAAIATTPLPHWMRVIRVPEGHLKTKPRAMNYALEFTTGEIVGVYDAEDAPAPDQLYRVAERFARASPDLACLQGILSFYNPHRNWLSRCFAFEYAHWFRIMLPGLQQLGLAIPLGGTTLFFRRDLLAKLGAWDAHNVTEDADLGMRLARHGYRCEMLHTVTQEEANSELWPWVRQRSRWLKGYAITWAVHMRKPLRLLRDLGLKRFLGFQLLFLGTLAAFFLAPALWISVIVSMLGAPHPVLSILPGLSVAILTMIYLLAELVSLLVFGLAAARLENRPSLIWIFTMPIYFTFATLAAYKGLFELLFRPFYWDKTDHGHFGGTEWQDLAVDIARVDLQPDLKRDGQVIAQRG